MNFRISKWFVNCGWVLSLTILTLISVSCSDEFGSSNSPASPRIPAASNAEIVMAAQEVMDITGAGMSSQGINYGRAAAHEGDNDWNEHRLCGAEVTKEFNLDNTFPDSLILTGSITIDFGDGTNCPDSANRHRKGKITTEFTINVNLKNHLFTSSETVTLEDFTLGSKTLSGIFYAKAASGGMRWLEITNAHLTHHPQHDDDDEDDSETDSVSNITWNGNLTFTYDNKGTVTREDDIKTITGSITGSTDSGTFSSEIAEAVTFKRSCFNGRNIPVSGIVNVTSAGVLTVVDFGDGTCDKLYTSTTAGETTELHL